MTDTRVGRITVQVDDLAAAAKDFAAALGVTFTDGTHPTSGRPMATCPVVTIVPRDANSVPGPLAEVELLVDDVDAVAADLHAKGIDVGAGADGAATADFHGVQIAVRPKSAVPPDSGEGPRTRFGRIVLAVDGIAPTAADLKDVFGIALGVYDVDNMRIRVGLGEQGVELIEKMDPVIDIEHFWHVPISGFAIQVPDIDAAKAQMAAIGAVVSHEFTTPGGMLEVYYGKPGLHGVPITLIPYHEDGALLDTMGMGEEGTDVSPTIA
jgi:hypothetical protein